MTSKTCFGCGRDADDCICFGRQKTYEDGVKDGKWQAYNSVLHIQENLTLCVDCENHKGCYFGGPPCLHKTLYNKIKKLSEEV